MTDAVPRSDYSARDKRAIRRDLPYLSPLLLLIGMSWLFFSVGQALRLGKDADIHRRWTVCQYVRRGIDPYRISLQALQQHYGPVSGRARTRLRDARIYAVPSEVEGAESMGIVAALGPPEATYPPSAVILLLITIGFVPEDWLIGLWVAVNLAALSSLVPLMRQHLHRLSHGEEKKPSWVPILAVLLMWPATHEAIRASQFSIVVIALVLLALTTFANKPLICAICLSVALVKPSLALPFLLLPLIRRRWVVLGSVVLIHVSATLLAAGLLNVSARRVFSEWLAVSQYFTAGMYTLQEIIVRLGLDNTLAGFAVTITFASCVFFWVWRHRSASDQALLEFLCFASVIWTYHLPYDFVVLLIPLLRPIGRLLTRSDSGNTAAPNVWWGLAFGIMGLGLSRFVYRDEGLLVLRLVRWVARLTLVAMFAAAAFRLRTLANKER